MEENRVLMRSGSHYFLLLIVCLLAACATRDGSPVKPDATQELEPLVFEKGNYRKDGTCTKLAQDNADLTPACNTYIGVIVLEDGRPLFTFSQQNGDFWAFTSSGPATFSNANKTAIYPVSHIYQMSSKLNMLYPGECRRSLDEKYEDIECTTWKDKSRLQPAWKATFVGSGAWRYKQN
jgi:hypothetical protein